MNALHSRVGLLPRRSSQIANALPPCLYLSSRNRIRIMGERRKPKPIPPEPPAITPPSTLPDLSKVTTLRAVHPQYVYRQKMRVIREKYAAEAAEKQKLEEEKQKQAEEMKKAKDAAFLAEIEAFKKARSRDFSYDGGRTAPSPVDSIISPKAIPDSPPDDIFAKRKAKWRARAEELSRRRFTNFVECQQRKSRNRKRALLFLYHAAANFVTYENMEKKIEEALSAGVAGVAADPELSELSLGKQREIALRDLMLGTMADGKLGLEEVGRILAEESGKEVDEKVADAQSFRDYLNDFKRGEGPESRL